MDPTKFSLEDDDIIEMLGIYGIRYFINNYNAIKQLDILQYKKIKNYFNSYIFDNLLDNESNILEKEFLIFIDFIFNENRFDFLDELISENNKAYFFNEYSIYIFSKDYIQCYDKFKNFIKKNSLYIVKSEYWDTEYIEDSILFNYVINNIINIEDKIDILRVFLHKTTRTYFINYINNFSKNKLLIEHITYDMFSSVTDYKYNLNTLSDVSLFSSNIIKICYNFWIKGIYNTNQIRYTKNLDKIDFRYIKSNKCTLNYCDIKDDDKEKDLSFNFLTEIYFIILKIIDNYYLLLKDDYIFRKKNIEMYKEQSEKLILKNEEINSGELREFEKNLRMNYNNIIINTLSSIIVIEAERVDFLNILLKSQINIIGIMSTISIDLINYNRFIYNDKYYLDYFDLVLNIITKIELLDNSVFRKIYESNDDYIDPKIILKDNFSYINLLIHIIKNVDNYLIKIKAFHLFNFWYNYNQKNLGINYIEFVSNKIIFHQNINNKNFFKLLINYYLYINEKIKDDIYYKIYNVYQILLNINIMSSDDLHESFIEVFNSYDIEKKKLILVTLLELFNQNIEYIDDNMKLINEYEEGTIEKSIIYSEINFIKNNILFIYEFIEIIKYLVVGCKDLMQLKEINNCFCNILNYSFDIFLNDKFNKEFTKMDEFIPKFNLLLNKNAILNSLSKIFIDNCMNEISLKYMVSINNNLDKTITNIINIDSFKFNDFEYKILDMYVQKIILLKQEKLEKENKEIDIPEEFLDPIMDTLIETPVILPNTNIFMDKDIISRHLITSDENPFNREKLKMIQLEEYNSRDDIKQKTDGFKKKINEWKIKVNY